MAATLPYELCILILDCLPTSGDHWKVPFSATALVCCGWTAHSQRKLFHSLVLSISATGGFRHARIAKIVYLAKHPCLASYVSELWFTSYANDLIIDMGCFAAAVLPNVKHIGVAMTSLTRFSTLMDTFPTVKTFELCHRPFGPIRAIKLPVQLQLTSCTLSCTWLHWVNDILLALLDTTSKTSLRHLSVFATVYSPESWTHYMSHVQAFSYLRHLKLSPRGGFHNRKSTSLFGGEAASLGHHPHLEVLELNLDDISMTVSHLCRLVLAARTRMPNLRELMINIKPPKATPSERCQVFLPFEPQAFMSMIIEPEDEDEIRSLATRHTFDELSASGMPLLTHDIAPNLQHLSVYFHGETDITVYPSSIWQKMLWEGNGHKIAIRHAHEKQIIHID